ncbi:hypothetical protein [Nonomuraea sp. NPDC005692]|uniref:hypothetical protein n=1 Tax=Nonomuraea sp. NPDC005692 TaxID=3157168 RepID=UPI0033E4004C
MISSQHEALHRVFRDNPELCTSVFKVLDIPFPSPTEVAVVDTDLTEIKPIERRADTIMMFTSLEGQHAVITESQSKPDDRKTAAWAHYISHVHVKFGCPVTLLVICQDEATAGWAALPKTIGLPDWPTLSVQAVVVGPHNIPVIDDLAEAVNDVVLTMFSALTHARSKEVAAILEVLADALDTTDTTSAGHIAEQTEVGLGNTDARRIWRDLMATKTYRYQSEYAQMLRAEGEAKGRAEGEAKALLRMLDRRGVVVPDVVRERILSCTDTAVIDTWIDRAVHATSLSDIFGIDDEQPEQG